MSVVAGVLPLLAFLLFWALALVVTGQRQTVGRIAYADSLARGAIIWGVCVVIFTEGLSVFHALTAGALAACWLLVAIIAAGALVAALRQTSRGFFSPDEQLTLPLAVVKRDYNVVWYLSLALTLLILGITGYLSAVTPPNNWDAMAYHLARVQHWMQNQSVGFYPTNDLRQLFDPPWAEYAMLQFQLLTGGDHLANFVQWFSELGTCVVIVLIAQRLGANRAGQGLALVFAVTTPMAILQASSPQNDFATSFWIVSFIYFALLFTRQPTLWNACMAGSALGLAALTKGTGYVFAAPALLALVIWLARRILRARRERLSWAGSFALLCLMGGLVIALNAGQYVRNEAVFSSPLGPDGKAYANQTFAPPALLCNAARDVSLELGASTEALNVATYHAVANFCSALGVDVNDARITWQGTTEHVLFIINGFNTDQGSVGNPVQFTLIALALALVAMLTRLRTRRLVVIYAALVALGFAFFCGYIRWQPWGNRLLLPWFMAAAPLVGMAFARLAAARVMIPVLEAVLLVAAAPCLLLNDNAPLIGATTVFNTPRLNQYFITNTPVEQPYLDAARFLNARGCADVGFHSVEGWEYPLWLIIGSKQHPARIEHVLITNASVRYAASPSHDNFHPCAIFNVKNVSAPEPDTVTVHGTLYRAAWSESMVVIYLPVSSR